MQSTNQFSLEVRGDSYLSDYSNQLSSAMGQRRALAALVAARVEAESANRAKSQFLANMSHELRTPLNAIIGFSEMLCNPKSIPKSEETAKEYAEYIHQSAQHLLSLINDVLNMSKIEHGMMELNCSSVDLDEVVSSSMMFVKERAELRGVTIKVRSHSGPVTLFADYIKLKQVLLNLLSNSVKFTPQGGGVIVSTRTSSEGNIRLVVRDTGIGMNVEQMEKALQPFGQTPNQDYDHNDGTGLGLPLARSLVELHGAIFKITSQPKVGTEIAIIFPKEMLVERANQGCVEEDGQLQRNRRR